LFDENKAELKKKRRKNEKERMFPKVFQSIKMAKKKKKFFFPIFFGQLLLLSITRREKKNLAYYLFFLIDVDPTT